MINRACVWDSLAVLPPTPCLPGAGSQLHPYSNPHPLQLPPTSAWCPRPPFLPSPCDLHPASHMSTVGWDGGHVGTGEVWSDFLAQARSGAGSRWWAACACAESQLNPGAHKDLHLWSPLCMREHGLNSKLKPARQRETAVERKKALYFSTSNVNFCCILNVFILQRAPQTLQSVPAVVQCVSDRQHSSPRFFDSS